MNVFTVYVALFGWPIFMAILAAFFPIRHVVLVSFVGGTLFLPIAGVSLPGFPDYTKPFATGLGAFLAAALVAAPRLLSCRPRSLDLFFIAFLVAPAISSLVNGLGPYDALSSFVNRFFEWGVAYWIGRALFTDGSAMRELALAFVIGGLVYIPFCLWEMRMSPQLHRIIYGYHPSAFGMTMRLGGYRPIVFMRHGLAVGVWMACATLVAWVLWRSKSVTHLWHIPMIWISFALLVVTILLRSSGAAIFLVGLIVAIEFIQISRLRFAILMLLIVPIGYIGIRSLGWSGQQILQYVSFLGDERVRSLEGRLENDALIVDRALQRPVFGWGGWGRWRVFDEYGNDITVSDSWWAILLGSTGIFGMVAAYGAYIWPMFMLIRMPFRRPIFNTSNGPAWAVGFAIFLFILDTLFNAMPNPSFMLASGAMASFVTRRHSATT